MTLLMDPQLPLPQMHPLALWALPPQHTLWAALPPTPPTCVVGQWTNVYAYCPVGCGGVEA